ncbi:bifunctional adenosylcobinamide kinase/adenosylcobinamide-phosphate guanylyltransferase [Aureibacter tunicatorum]|uniref:Adenosylcobinamide kinase n=1 Tax=Aureibacter tunicatorum TaxID=866807 RepID=A0AAE4BVD8_9BACT|nr:bifunctional adenosylcobinamide kinase/adenosylcobinamide-phosphate guanylyltransferase [Aureibacter tunicatorum]MDR6241648.1 adenosylcobinamide kinase/adenosylcobinamide-phosphate guanylyltransferase [Aureibacter tunicatorum]BDD07365.1 adenosylcobinamide kinase/adenosylcobinamide phosphate guanyltransferase [Aureibacter tunicatorum]
MDRVIFITGGQRSGKSTFAESICKNMTGQKYYLATSRIWDDGFAKRVKSHIEYRGDEWETFEIEKNISSLNQSKGIVLLECVTLWVNNFFYDNDNDIDLTFQQVADEWQSFLKLNHTLVVVSNEIGLGGTPMNTVQRKFTDLLGKVNQMIAKNSDEAYFIASGLPLKLK